MKAPAAPLDRRPARRRARARRRHERVIAAKIFGGHVVAAECLGERDDAEAQRFPGLDPAAPPRRSRVSQTISEEPPPMSNSTIDSRFAVGKFAAAGRGQRGLGLAIDDLQIQPEPLAHLLEKLGAVLGRAAGLGGDRAGRASRRAPPSCRGRRAAPRSCARSPARPSRPLCDRPSPRRTMRENASMTRNPSAVGRATSSRQLLVPRSSAA